MAVHSKAFGLTEALDLFRGGAPTAHPTHAIRSRWRGAHRTLLFGAALATAALAGCSGDAAPLGVGVPVTGGDESTGSQSLTAGGPVIGAIELAAPAERDFIVRATLPVPPGTWNPRQDDPPFSVLNLDGSVAPTQIEAVSLFADASEGADVVELIARVRRPDSVAPGARLRYRVAEDPHAERDLDLLPIVRSFFDGPDQLMLQTRDVFGNVYTADLFRDVQEHTGDMKVVRKGELVKEFMTHETLLARAPESGPQGTMPHMMGVHSFITFYEGEAFFTLDLHVHNGLSGLDQADPRDDALQELYFDALELRIPQGWRVQEAFETPFGGPGRDENNYRYYPIVRRYSNGDMHMMPRQSRLVRRLVVSRPGHEAHARAVVEGRHQAFCLRGTTPTGGENYSWWNGETARYYPQNHRLPSLDHVGLAALRQGHLDRLSEIEAQVASGASGSYPFTEPMLGWAHPWGVPYGGMTGGDEIWLYDGVDTAAAASNAGYRMAQLVSRLYIDRQPIALFNKNGEPTRQEDWLRPQGINGPYMPMYFSLTPKLPDNDPFGFNNAPAFQTHAVAQMGKKPDYANRLSDFKPIDFQHFVRYTRNVKTLAWLGNDSLSKLELRLGAELFRLGFHMYPNSNYNHIQNSGLLARTLFVEQHPGQGMGFGRGESWALDTAIAAYAMGDETFRERYYPWFQIVAQLLEEGQSTCTGFIQAWQSTNYLNGEYRLRQSYETAITENMIKGMAESVFRSEDDACRQRLEQVVLRSARGNTRPPFWSESNHAPWNFMAVGPYSNDEPLYCENVPENAHSPNFDRNQYWSSLAYAYEISGDELFLFRAAEMAGGGDLLNHMQASGVSNIGNMSALIALVQELRGIQ